MDKALARASFMLRIAAIYIRKHCPDELYHYDEADCDGMCIADDCDAAAEELRSHKHTVMEPVHNTPDVVRPAGSTNPTQNPAHLCPHGFIIESIGTQCLDCSSKSSEDK